MQARSFTPRRRLRTLWTLTITLLWTRPRRWRMLLLYWIFFKVCSTCRKPALLSLISHWAYHRYLLHHGSAVLNVLYNFLAWLFCGDALATTAITIEKKVSVQHKDGRRSRRIAIIWLIIMSIAQDVIDVATQGHVRTPKHFMLQLSV